MLQAFWIVEIHGEEWPKMTAVIASILTYAFLNFMAIPALQLYGPRPACNYEYDIYIYIYTYNANKSKTECGCCWHLSGETPISLLGYISQNISMWMPHGVLLQPARPNLARHYSARSGATQPARARLTSACFGCALLGSGRPGSAD